MRNRRVLGAVGAVLALVVPAGCAALPTSGEPHEFAIEAPQREPLRQYGSAPQVGSTPERLVDDFLLASSAGTYDDYATARLYLTAEASVAWHPGEQVIIFPSDSPPEPLQQSEDGGTAEVVLTMETIGSLDGTGVLNATRTAGTTTSSFVLERNADGEWRIAQLEPGLILSQSAFLNTYQLLNIFFPSADLTALVPDPRWLPRTRAASHLMQGLIDGPSENIMPAVTGALGANLALPTAGVDVKDRVATVVLEGGARISQEERMALYWSIHQTLKQLPAVQTISVRLNGVELSEAALPEGPTYRLDRVVGVKEGAIVSGSSQGSIVIATAKQAGEDARYPIVGPLVTSPYAWVNPNVGTLSTMDSEDLDGDLAPTVHEVEAPSAPSVDRWGSVWVTSGVGAGSVLVVQPGGALQTVTVGREGVAEKVTVSPDGARAAVLMKTGERREVVLAAVVRDEESGGYTLAQAHVVTQISDGATDITWIGDATLAALVGGGSGEPTVEIYPLDGWVQTMSAPSEMVRLTASATVGSLIVQGADSTAYQRVGAAWIELHDELSMLSYAG